MLDTVVEAAPLPMRRSMGRQSLLKKRMVFHQESRAWGCLFPSRSFGDLQLVPLSMCISFDKTKELWKSCSLHQGNSIAGFT